MNSKFGKKILQATTNSFIWSLGKLSTRISKNTKKSKILIIRIDGIGDIVLFLPMLQSVLLCYADNEIYLLVRKGYEELIKSDKFKLLVIDYNKYRKNIFYKIKFLTTIKKTNFSKVLYPGTSRERIGDEIVLWSNAIEKIGWGINSSRMTHKEKTRGDSIYTKLVSTELPEFAHEQLKNNEFLLKTGINLIKKPDINSFFNSSNKTLDIKDYRYIALIPGGLSTYRKWPIQNWNSLLLSITNKIDRIRFVVIGDKTDNKFIQKLDIINNNELLLNLCGKIKLNELVHIFKQCSLVIGNETGPMHLAILADIPTITILGGGNFGKFMPYGSPRKNIFVHKDMDCFQCSWNCKYNDFRCVSLISVDEILEKTLKILLNKDTHDEKS